MKFDERISLKNRFTQHENYERAMEEALSEIFENLKEIERDRKLPRKIEIVDCSRRRGSAPARTLKEKSSPLFQTPKEILRRQLSTPMPSNFLNSSQGHCNTRQIRRCWRSSFLIQVYHGQCNGNWHLVTRKTRKNDASHEGKVPSEKPSYS